MRYFFLGAFSLFLILVFLVLYSGQARMSVDVMALVGVDVYLSYVSGEARGVHEPVIRESGCVWVCEIWRAKKKERIT